MGPPGGVILPMVCSGRSVVARLIFLVVACALFAASLRAGEEDVYKALMRRYDAVNDELKKTLADIEYQMPPPDIPERSLSMRRNASVTIGGDMRTVYAYHKNTLHDPGFNPNNTFPRVADEKVGNLEMPNLKLLVDARINNRLRVFLDVNASGTRGMHRNRVFRNPNRPGDLNPTGRYTIEEESDILGQAYAEFMKADHSGFGFLVGRMKLPFGLWNRPNLFAQSFMDAPNLNGSYLAGDHGHIDRALLPHASRMIDPVYAAMVNYEMRDIIRFDAAIFQEKDVRLYSKHSGGTYSRIRSEESVPQSWQIGASIMPLDGWELTAHFRNRHNNARGLSAFVDSPFRWDFRNALVSGAFDPRWDENRGQWSDQGTGESFGSRRNEQSFIIGLGVEVPNTNLAVRAEYARGWNQNFNRHIKSENINVGLTYKLTPKLSLHGQGEWLQVKDGSWMTSDGSDGWTRDKRHNHLYRTMLGLEYEAFKGLTIEAGWQYEYWRMKSALGSDGLGKERHINKAHLFYLGTRFTF